MPPVIMKSPILCKVPRNAEPRRIGFEMPLAQNKFRTENGNGHE